MQDWELKPARDIGLPLGQRACSVRREGGLIHNVTHLIWAILLAIYLNVAHRLSVEGREHLPANGPFVLVANHCSHLDSLALSSALPWRLQSRCYPVAAGDTFFSSPLVGTLSALLINALPMWRGRSYTGGMRLHCVSRRNSQPYRREGCIPGRRGDDRRGDGGSSGAVPDWGSFSGAPL
jgi:hypothetical protein